jgi:hypothetical protein
LEDHAFIFVVEEYAKQETSVKSGGKQSSWLADILDYVGNRRELDESKAVPIHSPAGQNEPFVPRHS